MDYGSIIKYLSTNIGRCCVTARQYTDIASWLSWYEGYVPSYHTRRITNGIGVVSEEVSQLCMAKRVCEDWASSLVNESVDITISSAGGEKRSNAFIQGSKGNGGVLGSNNFNVCLNNAIETMFALGTSAIVIDLDKVILDAYGNISKTESTEVKLKYYNATCVIPISSSNGVITEAAFLSEFTEKGKTYYSLSIHVLEEDGYVVYNNVLDTTYSKVTLNVGVVEVVRTKSPKPMFIIIKPNVVNNKNLSSPMGLSIFGNSVSILKAVDNSYDACIREILTGQRIIFMNKKILPVDDMGRPIAPQDIKKSYMQFVDDNAMVSTSDGVSDYVKDFTPTIRTEQMDMELQNQLNILSNNCGLGTKYYQFENGSVTTATEYVGERNDFMRNVKKHSHMLESAIKSLVSQLLWVGKNILELNLDVNSKIVVKVSDGVIEDDSKEREQDKQDVKDGIMSKAEYRAKWYNESIEEATAAVDAITNKPSIS